jgi:hypothetical protein
MLCEVCDTDDAALTALVGGVHANLCPPCVKLWEASALGHQSHGALYGKLVKGEYPATKMPKHERDAHEARLRDHAVAWLAERNAPSSMTGEDHAAFEAHLHKARRKFLAERKTAPK